MNAQREKQRKLSNVGCMHSAFGSRENTVQCSSKMYSTAFELTRCAIGVEPPERSAHFLATAGAGLLGQISGVRAGDVIVSRGP